MISFFVPGVPATAGSKRSFFAKRTGKIITKDDCERGKGWRSSVQAFAYEAAQGRVLQGPVRLVVAFVLPRPKGHYGKRGLLPGAPHHPTTRPDATKLLRALEDALTGILWADDAQVVHLDVRKVYAAPGGVPGAEVCVRELLAGEP